MHRISQRVTDEAGFPLDLHFVDNSSGHVFRLIDELPGTLYAQIAFFHSGGLH